MRISSCLTSQSWLLGFIILIAAAGCQKSNFQRTEPTLTPPPLEEPVTTAPIVPPPKTDDLVPKGPIFQDCEKDSTRHMMADLYALAPDTQKLPDFQQVKLIKTLCLINLDITDRDFKEGFPGVDGLIEWFALNIKFKLQVTTAGDYEFFLNSDDGSRLFIDDREVIDNDEQHSQTTVSAIVPLTAGIHSIRVPYFQGPRYNIALELFWKGPQDTEKKYLPLNLVQRP